MFQHQFPVHQVIDFSKGNILHACCLITGRSTITLYFKIPYLAVYLWNLSHAWIQILHIFEFGCNWIFIHVLGLDLLCITDSKLLEENQLVRIRKYETSSYVTTDKHIIYFLISINGNFAYRLLTLKEVEGI